MGGRGRGRLPGRRPRPRIDSRARGSGPLTLLTVLPGKARAAGALAADVVAAGTVLTLAHTPAVLPVKCCWAACRETGWGQLWMCIGTKPVSSPFSLSARGEDQ